MRSQFAILRFVYIAALVFMCLYSDGCSTYHTGADLSNLDRFTIERNVTTDKDLVKEFGEPNNTTSRSDGSKVMIWADSRAEGSVNPLVAVPVVGAFAHSDAHATHRALTATINDGVVIDYTISGGQSGAN